MRIPKPGREPAIAPNQNEQSKPKKPRFSKTRILVFCAIFAIAFGVYINISSNEKVKTILEQFAHLITSKNKSLKGENEDRINILLLGIGGEGHEGPNLTDTIMMASYKPSTKKAVIMSIPRDLLVSSRSFGTVKINHIFALAEAKGAGSGGQSLAGTMQEIFSIPIHYYIKIDFDGFVKLIDQIGGITVNVENVLDDEFYPVPGKENAATPERFEHLIIEKGIQTFDGKTVLKYIRSRKAKGIEGSDFARSQRQQKVVLAIKEKILSFGTFFNPNKINNIINILGRNINTDIEIGELMKFYQLAKNISTSDIINITLDDSESSPLKSIADNGGYYLVTKSGDYLELQNIAINIFNPPSQLMKKNNDFPSRNENISRTEKIYKIVIHNGTKVNGLASRVADFLAKKNYNIIEELNAPQQTYKKTLIYNLNPGGNNSFVQKLNVFFNGIIFDTGLPDITDTQGNTLPYPINPQAEILIILGEDQKDKF